MTTWGLPCIHGRHLGARATKVRTRRGPIAWLGLGVEALVWEEISNGIGDEHREGQRHHAQTDRPDLAAADSLFFGDQRFRVRTPLVAGGGPPEKGAEVLEEVIVASTEEAKLDAEGTAGDPRAARWRR